MADREKVIKALEKCLSECCKGCPYFIDRQTIECINNMQRDALELLKEQEAIKPEIGKPHDEFGSWWFKCGACDYPIDPDDEYCRHCGRAVKWGEGDVAKKD